VLGRFFSKPKTKPRGLNEEFSEAMAVKEIAPGSQEAGRVALGRSQRGQELILDIFNPCGAHNEAVLAAGYFSAFSPT
jgi:hypothetical protein